MAADSAVSPSPSASRWPKRVLWSGLLGLAAGCLYVAAAGIAAGWSVARPGSRDPSDRQRQDRENPSRLGLRVITAQAADGTPYLFCTPDPIAGPGERGVALRAQLTADGHAVPAYGFTSATVVLLHGRMGSKDGMLGIAERFAAAGFRVLIPDLPGHGAHPVRSCGYGAGPGEDLIPETVFKDAAARFGFPDDQRVLLWGMSMGGSFAIHAAARNPKWWDGLIIVSSFAHLGQIIDGELARWTGPLTPPARAIAGKTAVNAGGVHPDMVHPELLATSIKLPVLVIHGSDDNLIPLSHGRRLHLAFSGKDKSWTEVTGADHWNVLITPQAVYAPMIQWARQRAAN